MSYLPTTVQSVAPATGATVVITEAANNVLLDVDPAGTLAALTIEFPATGRPSQEIVISFTRAITLLTLTNVAHGALTTVALGSCLRFVRATPTRIHRIAS